MKLKPLYLFNSFFILLLTTVLSTANGQTVQKLDSLYGTLYKQGNFNGCILVAEDGKPVYEKAFGYANFENKQLLTNQTMFELASVSKQFTAMAIMQLHQKGKLSYNDSLTKYFPELPYHGITIDHLLHHTSGILEMLGFQENQIDTKRINYNKDVVTAFVKNKIPVNFPAGSNLSYSNTNYVLLALIVEKVSGMPFGDYMDKNIFKPLGMAHTKVYSRRSGKEAIKDYAMGHVFSPAKNAFVINDSIPANKYQYYLDGVAGPYGISSNTEDMLKWDQALYTEKLVTKAEQALAYIPSTLTNGKTASLTSLPYGFGWLLLPDNDYAGKRYMHTGGYPGYMTMITRYPEAHKTVIILTNIWNVINLYQLGAATEQILFDRPFTIPTAIPFQKSVAITQVQAKAVEGVYSFKQIPGMKLSITNQANQTYAQMTGQITCEIYPEDDLDFFYSIVAAKIKFVKDDKGVISKLILTQNGQQLEAVKE